MCLSIPVLSSLHRPYKRSTPRGRGHPNLVVPARTTHVEFQVSGSLWNCRSAANKAEFISAYASLQSLDFLALTETWITTDNTATPTALSSSAHVFSHTPRASDHFRRPSPLPHLAHQLIPDRWLRPFRLQESESCTPSEKTYTRSLRCQQLQTNLSAAFDTVNHQILLSTLSELGISGAAHAWIASYLTGRSYQVANRISACLADISVWMTDHHLKLNLGKTELLFLPGKDCPFHDLAITVDNSIVSSSQSAKNLGVILDNTLSFSTNIKAVARSCRFMLYNIRRVRPCLTQEAAQVLIQALVISRLDYCNSLLAGLPACAIKPLQLIQNAAARLVFNLPKFSHVTPLLRSLHWLPVEARIRYKTMVLAYGAVRGTAPQYLQALIRPYTQTRALRSSTSGLLASLPLRKYSSR
ncbi:uncharacterized protein ACWYII_015339 [Salvelinus alpinus]